MAKKNSDELYKTVEVDDFVFALQTLAELGAALTDLTKHLVKHDKRIAKLEKKVNG